jgi:hypothetical protein
MGSWSNTCVISKMPILAGDPCRLVLLGGHYARHHSYSSPTHAYAPVCRPIRGVYDDYGRVKIADEAERIFFIKKMKVMGFLAVDNLEFSRYWEEAFEFLQDGKAMMGRSFDVEGSFCIISETVYEKMADDFSAMRHDINTCLLPIFNEIKQKVLADTDYPMGIRIAQNDDQKNFIQMFVAPDPRIRAVEGLRILTMYGFDLSGPRHHLSNRIYDSGRSIEEDLHEIGELQVLNEFLTRIRGFWSHQAFHMQTSVYAKDYRLLISMMSADLERFQRQGRY